MEMSQPALACNSYAYVKAELRRIRSRERAGGRIPMLLTALLTARCSRISGEAEMRRKCVRGCAPQDISGPRNGPFPSWRSRRKHITEPIALVSRTRPVYKHKASKMI